MLRVRVLMVDDCPVFLSMAERILAFHEDIEIVGWSASGQEAVLQIPRLAPNLVLMDLSMPGMNGLEATSRIKARPGSPWVVILTIHDGAEYRAAAEAAGADGYVMKARLRTELLPVIARLRQGVTSETKGG